MNGAPDEGVAQAARTLRTLQGAMAGGVALFGAVVVFLYFSNAGKVPPENALRTLKLLSAVCAVFTVALWAVSAFVFTAAAKPGTLAAAQAAFITRAAMREGAALLGLVICFLGALNGALRTQPLFWAASLPAWLFVGWAIVTLPDEHAVGALLDASSQKR